MRDVGSPAIPKFLLADASWHLIDDDPMAALQDKRAIIVHLIPNEEAVVAPLQVHVVRRGVNITCDVAGKGFGEGEGRASGQEEPGEHCQRSHHYGPRSSQVLRACRNITLLTELALGLYCRTQLDSHQAVNPLGRFATTLGRKCKCSHTYQARYQPCHRF